MTVFFTSTFLVMVLWLVSVVAPVESPVVLPLSTLMLVSAELFTDDDESTLEVSLVPALLCCLV